MRLYGRCMLLRVPLCWRISLPCLCPVCRSLPCHLRACRISHIALFLRAVCGIYHCHFLKALPFIIIAVTKPSTGRGIVPGFDFPAKANTIKLLVLWSDGRIVAWSSPLRLVQLITRSPRDLEPHVAEFSLTTLSKKGGAVSAISPM